MAALFHRAAIIMHGLYDIAMVPNLMISQVSQTRGNMYKLQKMYSSMILENICSLVELFIILGCRSAVA